MKTIIEFKGDGYYYMNGKKMEKSSYKRKPDQRNNSHSKNKKHLTG